MTWSCESRRACRDASRAGSLCALKQRALACSHWDCSAAAAPCLAYVTCSGLRLCSVSTAAKASMSAFRGSRSLGSDRMAGGGPPRPSRARARPGRLACSTSAARRTRTTWPSWPTCSRTCAGAPLRSNPTLTLHRGLQDRRTCVPAVRTPSYGGLASAWARGLAGWEAAPPASRARAPHAARARRAGATRRWCLCWTSWTRSRGGLNRRCSTRCWTRCTAPTCRRAPPPLRSASRPARTATTPVWAATIATATAHAARPHLHSAWPCSRALPAAEAPPRAQRRSGVWQPDARARRRAVRGRVRQRVRRRDAHDGEARAVAFLVPQGAALLRLRAISCG